MHLHLLTCFLFVLLILGLVVTPRPVQASLQFDGSPGNFVEIPDPSNGDFSVSTTDGLTISAWIQPGAVCFLNTDGLGYVHWLGKGCPWVDALGKCCTVNPLTGRCVEIGATPKFEWTFRMYSQDNGEGRDNRTSFYVFNLPGGEGIGSFFQDPVEAGEWIHVVGAAEQMRDPDTGTVTNGRVSIYKNGVFRKCDQYTGASDGKCQRVPAPPPPRDINPQHGTAPLRIGHRDRVSYFQGGIARVRIWNRKLTDTEVADLYFSGIVLRNGLVAEYLLNENVGNIAHDTHDTVGAHDGTINGTTWAWGTDPEPGP